ncbi:MAG: ATP-binding cassette domain-containing protein [Candidatus Tantalella remota]|nr:ATP-binding cassette domain-containing protein [Candidatus Tantalella remota]
MIKFENVKKYFYKKDRFLSQGKNVVKAVDGVTFSVDKGTTFGLVGESGSGKSTIAKIAVGILSLDSGVIEMKGDCDIVFQDPYSSLNPRMTVNEIVSEALYIRGRKKDLIDKRVDNVLGMVRLERAAKDKYPHQFSGGERQRVAIARALVTEPAVLVLDEPVSSLDVSIQAGVLNLLKDLQEELSLTYLFISHDLRVVEFMSDMVGVMRSGQLVEVASREEIYSSPKDDYTRHLLASIPKL